MLLGKLWKFIGQLMGQSKYTRTHIRLELVTSDRTANNSDEHRNTRF